jgi:hypothetical protein
MFFFYNKFQGVLLWKNSTKKKIVKVFSGTEKNFNLCTFYCLFYFPLFLCIVLFLKMSNVIKHERKKKKKEISIQSKIIMTFLNFKFKKEYYQRIVLVREVQQYHLVEQVDALLFRLLLHLMSIKLNYHEVIA